MVLTKEEEAEALYWARAKKWGIENDKKIAADHNAKKEDLMRPWSKPKMMEVFKYAADRIVKERGKKEFLIDNDNRAVISNLAGYFTGAESPLLPDRGNLLMGGVGNGKTTIMEAFGKNKKGCFKKLEAWEMVHYVKNHGSESWKIFLKGSESPGMPENFYQRKCGWLIDDIGTEEVVMDFGFRLDVVANIIFAIEKDRNRYGGMFHFTTNLDANKLNERYGQRVTSRLRELCNQVVLTGEDRRV